VDSAALQKAFSCTRPVVPVETFAVHNFEATLAENVDGQSLPRAHVIDFGLASCAVLEVPVRRHIRRRHIFLRISPIKNPMKYIIVLAVGHSQGPT
jgi:hypothetical protein